MALAGAAATVDSTRLAPLFATLSNVSAAQGVGLPVRFVLMTGLTTGLITGSVFGLPVGFGPPGEAATPERGRGGVVALPTTALRAFAGALFGAADETVCFAFERDAAAAGWLGITPAGSALGATFVCGWSVGGAL